ncbi:MAG TPA: hypothetical protein VJN92_04470 [Candidatus Acidoferrum sp.]|nr:hypothetical protein [Candidatus Acidoferrum sp.]
MRTDHVRRQRTSGVLVFLVAIISAGLPARAQELAARPHTASQSTGAKTIAPTDSGDLLSVDLAIKGWKQVRKGHVVEGHLALPVYMGQQRILPSGATIRLTIESIEKANDKCGAWKKFGRGIVRAFNPLEKSVLPEYSVKLKGAEIVYADGRGLAIDAEVLRAGTGVMIQPEKRSGKVDGDTVPQANSSRSQKQARARMLLCVQKGVALSASEEFPGNEEQLILREGKARAFLLDHLSASRNRPGDRFQAVLAEPARVGGHDLEAGSLVEGKVIRSAPPRMLSRAGLLQLQVDRLVLPKETIAVRGNLSGSEAGRKSVVLDGEGRLRGLKPGLKNALVDLGYAYTIGKVADDVAEAPIRAAGAVMSDAAVANAARYFGLGGSAIFLVTRHGRDVQLAKYAEIEIEFGRVDRPRTSISDVDRWDGEGSAISQRSERVRD